MPPKPPPWGKTPGSKYPRSLKKTPGKPAGFLANAKNPFAPAPPHPHRSPPHLASQKIDCGSHSNCDGNSERTIMHGYPLLLFGTAERDKEQIGSSIDNAATNFVMIHLKQLVKRGRVKTCDVQAWKLPRHILNRLCRRFRRSAKKKDAVALILCLADE